MAYLKLKGHQVTQIESQSDNKNMEHPPAGLISHKVSDHHHLQRIWPRV
jgi:hypothetical protein